LGLQKDCFQSLEECGYLQLPWPPNSPSPNPIENLWLLLKRQCRKRFSEKEHRPHSAHELFATTQEEWKEIDWGTIDDLIDSMPHRIQAVIEADRGHTK
jgi:transposase